jgi:ParB family chromosome partitioning protein
MSEKAKKGGNLVDDLTKDIDGGDDVSAKFTPNPDHYRITDRFAGMGQAIAGERVTKVEYHIDPARCRIWEGNGRRYDLLNEANCADLIEGFKAQGKQEYAAVVRRVNDDPNYDFEVITGTRRHWTVSWLRAHNYPQFKFYVDVRNLTDEEAFRLADIENRDRRDISDYERGVDYARAIANYYHGSQKAMAERLEMSPGYLSKFLALAALPDWVVGAYKDVTHLNTTHAPGLNKLLKSGSAAVGAAKKEAAVLSEEQKGGVVEGATVYARLMATLNEKKASKTTTYKEAVAGTNNSTVIGKPTKTGFSMEIANIKEADRAQILEAIKRVLARYLE